MEEKEIWKDIEGFEGLYQVSNMGRVKSLERTVWNKGTGYYMTVSERILKANNVGKGYLQVKLFKDGKRKTCYIHRIVATAFLDNPKNYNEVNHKDEDKTNNCVDNLEWCSHSYNNNYGTKNQRAVKKLSKPVIGVDKVTGLILEFPSAKEAGGVLGIDSSHITQCCKGKYKSIGGFVWHYADTE